jgi:Carboxypeptidase regulatory-like domain
VRYLRSRTHHGHTLLWLLVLTFASIAHAQLPPTPASPQPLGSISGVVTDANGDGIAGAHITLSGPALPELRRILSGPNGRFTFDDVPAQRLTLTIAAEGFGPATNTLTLAPGEDLNAPTIALDAATNIDVEVGSRAQEELAEQQIHIEETQRLIGIVPNFFVTYNWHAAPLTSRQKYQLAWKSVIDPMTFVVNGGIAGVQQWQGDLKGYGEGAQGYGKRYGAATADFISGTVIGGAIVPSILHQDPRYFYMGDARSVPIRALYSLSTAVICRGDNGRWQPNYSSVLGDLAAGSLSNLYYPVSDRHGIKLTVQNGLLGAAFDGVNNLLQEFVLRRVTPHTH